jgi:hypothetical protein
MLRASDELRARAIGSLPTSEEGSFEGSVVVPRDVPAGDYVIFAFTRGDRQCGAGRSE